MSRALARPEPVPSSILLVCNSAWGLFNFRAGLIRDLVARGHQVEILAPADGATELLAQMGCVCHSLQLDSRGVNPVHDLGIALRVYRAYRRIRPTMVIQYTIKPVIYGSIACRLLGIPVVNVITGLGTAFEQQGWLTRVACILYRLSQREAHKIYFLNDDDRTLFLKQKLALPHIVETLPGEGVNGVHFRFAPLPEGLQVTFLMIARLLIAKGVREYVEAARILSRKRIPATLRLLGPFDTEPLRGVSRREVDAWVREGVIEYMGEARDVRPAIEAAHCIVLPSFYREGMPRVLLEAAAMGRPVITTDNVGCRDVVVHGETGFLCAPRDATSLALAMETFVRLNRDERSAMGRAGRELVESRFEERHVIARYMATLQEILPKSKETLPDFEPLSGSDASHRSVP